MNRYPWIIWFGGGILGYVAGEMMLKDDWIKAGLGRAADLLHYPLPIALGVILTALGWWMARRSAGVPERA